MKRQCRPCRDARRGLVPCRSCGKLLCHHFASSIARDAAGRAIAASCASCLAKAQPRILGGRRGL